MSFAVCVRCGAGKAAPMRKCASCGFQPRSDEEKARSLILSLDYEIEGEYRGRPRDELAQIGARIRNGVPYEFDAAEVRAVVDYARTIQAIPRGLLLRDLVRWIGPVIVIFILLFALLKWDK